MRGQRGVRLKVKAARRKSWNRGEIEGDQRKRNSHDLGQRRKGVS